MSSVRLISLLLALITLALFSRVRHFEFINFDDPAYVTDNTIVQQGVTSDGLAWAFGKLHGYETYWHPITWVSHMLDCQFFGADAGAHHIVNVLFHTLNVLLLFHLLHRMTGHVWRSAMVAALFAFHPLQVDTVAWVSERKNVLSGMFWLLAMLAYVRFTESQTRGRYSLIIIFMALGLMSKPVLVTLPCVLLLMDVWPLKRIDWSANRHKKAPVERGRIRVSLRRAVLEKLPLLGLSLVSSIITIAGHIRLGATLSEEEFPLPARLANAAVSYVRYLSRTIWPTDLSVYYPMQPWQVWQITAAILAVFTLSALVLLQRRSRPYLLVGWFWFLGVLVPVIGIVQASTQAMADRFAYLPLIGLFIAVVWLAADFLGKLRQGKAIASVLAGFVLLAACLLASRQLSFWRDSITLFTHALRVTKDNAVAHNNLGSAMESAQRPHDAETHYRHAIRLKPALPQAHNNLGNVLDEIGRSEEALAAYQQALKLRPNVVLVHNNLGVVLAKLGRFDEARTNFDHALKLQPRNGHTHYLYGTLHLRRGDARSAVGALETSLKFNPNHVRALSLLARLHAASDDPSIRNGARAIQLAEHAVALADNSMAAALDTLAIAYAAAGRFDEAVQAEEQACSILEKSKGSPSPLAQMRQRRELFKARQPYREQTSELVTQLLND